MTADALSWSLIAAAAGIAVIHTLVGPDHYLPFIMLARARGWSTARTLVITAACGLGHVASSVLLGSIGIAAGIAVGRLETIEGSRGNLAAWALVAIGVAYGVWGLRRALRHRAGLEAHVHGSDVHIHSRGVLPHRHGVAKVARDTTFWALFLVFVLGPCEPLIPLFMIPASRSLWGTASLTAGVFAVTTIACMLVATAAGLAGIRQLRLGALERWSHALAGGIIALSGIGILYLGL
jgi:nickel/cobalt exporter